MTAQQKRGWLVVVTALAFALMAFPVFAKGAKAPNPNDGRGKITAISSTSITVNNKKDGAKTYVINDATKVTIDGKPGAVGDIKLKQHANIKSNDGTTALSIKVGGHKKKKDATGTAPTL